MREHNTIVLGAGVGGIAAALRFRAKGHRVILIEAQKATGGKLSVWESNGFRFDKGPSLFTLPHLVDELYSLFDKNPRDYFNYEKLETVTRYFWEDGTILNTYSNSARTALEVQKTLGVSAEEFIEHLNNVRNWYELAGDIFLESDLHSIDTWISKKAFRAYGSIFSLPLTGTMHEYHSRKFKEPHFVQFLDRYATYNGSSPYAAPAMLSMIPDVELNQGAFFPKNGMYAIVEGLTKLAHDVGIEIKTNEPVERLKWHGNQVMKVQTSKAQYHCDTLVNNIDIKPFYEKLTPEKLHPKKQLKQERSSSAVVFYWGMSKEFPELDVHNILFSKDYEKEFKALFEKKRIFQDPTIYIHISSKVDSGTAPKGKENWFVMMNVPAIKNEPTNFVADCEKIIKDKIKRTIGVEVDSYIECSGHWSPASIERDTGSARGALYGSSSNNMLSAFNRHQNHRKELPNTYFVGGSVHPGGGIPLCLLSAKIAAKSFQE